MPRKDPSQRFQHMDDMKVALEELKAGVGFWWSGNPLFGGEETPPVQGVWLPHHHLPRSSSRSLVLVWSSTSDAVGSLTWWLFL